MYCYFNSIKVRLERSAPQYVAKYVKFQFHKGTIRTDLSHNDVFSCAPFQFHKGTIRTLALSALFGAYSHFNSIKVRLELTLGKVSVNRYRFQFHKGTIRTIWLIFILLTSCTFQFHKGTIRTRVDGSQR